MARNSYQTYLMNSTDDGKTWAKLVDVKDIPALGGDPEQIDATTLSDSMTKNINGIQSLDALTFTANYDKTDFTALKTHENKVEHYAVWFGADTSGAPDGNEGKFSWTGSLTVYADAESVNAVGEMKVTISAETEIVFA